MRARALLFLLCLLALAAARMGGKRRPRAALPTLNATEQQRVFERATDAVHVAGAEPFGCPGDAFNVSVVHLLRDAPRLERFVGAIRNASYDVRFEVWPGFVVAERRDELDHYVRRGVVDAPKARKSLGSIGAALAHLSLWEALLRRGAALSLVLEDDATFEPPTRPRLCAVLAALRGGFDYVNLAALRPRGDAVAGLPGVARVRKELVGEPMPNVVMSAYAVTARGLRRLMDCFLRRRPDISGFHQSGLIDRFVSQYCFSRGPLRAFVVDAKNDTGRVFGHYNKGALSVRKAMNGRVRRR